MQGQGFIPHEGLPLPPVHNNGTLSLYLLIRYMRVVRQSVRTDIRNINQSIFYPLQQASTF